MREIKNVNNDFDSTYNYRSGKRTEKSMTSEEIDLELKGIVESYFEGKDLTELLQATVDKITIKNIERCLLNFKG